MLSCENCRHFRPVTPIDTALSDDVRVTGPDVVKALEEVGKELEDQRMAEWEEIRKTQRTSEEDVGRAVWAPKVNGQTLFWEGAPLTTGYCASDSDQCGVAEIKVLEAPACGYEEGPPRVNSCAACEHHVVGHEGADRAARALAAIQTDSALGILFRGGPPAPITTTPSQELVRTIGPLAAHEIRATLLLRGVLPDRPGFVSYCSALSSAGQYVVCVFANRHGDCPHFSPGAAVGDRSDAPHERRPPPPPPPLPGRDSPAPPAPSSMGMPSATVAVAPPAVPEVPPPPAAPAPALPEGVFALVDGQSFTHPGRQVQVGAGLFPLMVRSELQGVVPGGAVLVWDPAAARWNPYALSSLPPNAWCTLLDAYGNQLPLVIYIAAAPGAAPTVLAKWL